jgi:hypothetical protein
MDDYMDVFIAPTELFRRRTDGRFGQALVVLVVLIAVLYFATRTAMEPIMDAEWQRGMAAMAKSNPSLTAEQMESGRKMAGTFGAIFIIGGTPIMVLLLGVAVWVAARIVGGAVSYAQGATIATFAMFPKLLDAVSGALQALFLDEQSLNSRYSVSLGVGRFFDVDTTSATLLAFVGRIDLFTIWTTVLVALGLKVMAKTGTGQAAAAAVIVWMVGGLPMILQALRTG